MTIYEGISRRGTKVRWPPEVGEVVSLPVETSAGQYYATDHVVIAHTERGYIVAPRDGRTPPQIDYRRARHVVLDNPV